MIPASPPESAEFFFNNAPVFLPKLTPSSVPIEVPEMPVEVVKTETDKEPEEIAKPIVPDRKEEDKTDTIIASTNIKVPEKPREQISEKTSIFSQIPIICFLENDVMQSIMRVPEPETPNSPTEQPKLDRKRMENVPRPPNYKTVPCRLYHSPVGCARGEFCHFIHDPEYAGRELPSDLWKSKRRRHESFYGPPPAFPGKMPMPLPMHMMPFFMGQPPMRMPNFPPMMPPRGFMVPPRGRSPEREHEREHQHRTDGERDHEREREHRRERDRDHDREHSHRSRSHGSKK